MVNHLPGHRVVMLSDRHTRQVGPLATRKPFRMVLSTLTAVRTITQPPTETTFDRRAARTSMPSQQRPAANSGSTRQPRASHQPLSFGTASSWATESHDRFLHLLAGSNGTVYLGTSDDELGFKGEELFAVRRSDGGRRWSVEAGDTTDAAVYGDTLYAVEGARRTTAFAIGDGRERWHRDMRPGAGKPRVFDETLYLESEQKNKNGNYPVVAVSGAKGRERWRFSLPVDEPFVPTGAVASGDTVYISEYDGWLYGVDLCGHHTDAFPRRQSPGLHTCLKDKYNGCICQLETPIRQRRDEERFCFVVCVGSNTENSQMCDRVQPTGDRLNRCDA